MSGVHDWDLVARAQAGDMRAFTGLVRQYQTPVMQFCLRMVGSAQDAEDIAQETFVRVFRHLHRLKPQAKFTTLLFGIARNLSLNHLRDSKRRGRGVTDSMESHPQLGGRAQSPDRAAELHEIASLIERGIERLSPEHREVLVLRELNGMDYESIARIVKCRKGTVKSRLARAREQLRQHLLELGGGHL
ncbi:MAG: sigma-70 family RNA polymerase sigma factor [Nitrospiraceae bacterium]|nr:sigma-70 family RNA polymerase sigma factor [Nitrospiraceae bacterium]